VRKHCPDKKVQTPKTSGAARMVSSPFQAARRSGLRGMRERAKLLGGKLTVWSEVETGTEAELSIPAANAYATADGRRRPWLAEKFAGKLV
jgi:signal transduction histidine kinase